MLVRIVVKQDLVLVNLSKKEVSPLSYRDQEEQVQPIYICTEAKGEETWRLP